MVDIVYEAELKPESRAGVADGLGAFNGSKTSNFAGLRFGTIGLLLKHPETDAVFCGADNLALGALVEARVRGIAVPAQISVLGYGDLNFAAYTDPPLTTMRIDGTRIGRLAASMLMDRIEEREVKQTVVDVGFELIERASA